jgi:hypothetical protein
MGKFFEYYQDLSDPLLVLGYPITDQYFDSLTLRTVQYFQKGRLDLVTTDGGEEVRVAPLGEYLYDTGAPRAAISTDSPSCDYFAETKHSVCYAFSQFYRGNDGESNLGLPISEVEIRENRMVQYFQNGRLEWRPELPSGQRVLMTDLGRIYFDKVVGDQSKIRPTLPSFIPAVMIEPQVHAFVTSSLAAVGQEQSVFIVVQDKMFRPVAQAGVGVVVTYPDGFSEILSSEPTNADGISKLAFTVRDAPARQIVTLAVTVKVQGQEAHTQTWFRVWW